MYCRMVKISWLSDSLLAWQQKSRFFNFFVSFPSKTSWWNFLSLPVVPVGDTGTIQHHLCNDFPGAPGDRWCRWWMQDVVCQLLGLGLVPWSEMNGKGAHRMWKGSISGNTLCCYVTSIAIVTIISCELSTIMQLIQKQWYERKIIEWSQ